ncbi:hypothetical protein G6F43_004780 [Rhizopus delemar]|nr:hypothetical protein G6F43_004780 [Rhizopus delemar]
MKEESGTTARFLTKNSTARNQRNVQGSRPSHHPLEEQQQAITKNANTFWKQGEVRNNFSISCKGSDNWRSTRMLRTGQRKLRLGHWRSRGSGSQTVLNTWKKNLQATNHWPWASKMWIKYSKQDMNSPCSEMQLEEDKIHSTNLVNLWKTTMEHKRKRPRTQTSGIPNSKSTSIKQTKPSVSSPKATVHYSIPEDDILPGERLQ